MAPYLSSYAISRVFVPFGAAARQPSAGRWSLQPSGHSFHPGPLGPLPRPHPVQRSAEGTRDVFAGMVSPNEAFSFHRPRPKASTCAGATAARVGEGGSVRGLRRGLDWVTKRCSRARGRRNWCGQWLETPGGGDVIPDACGRETSQGQRQELLWGSLGGSGSLGALSGRPGWRCWKRGLCPPISGPSGTLVGKSITCAHKRGPLRTAGAGE